MSSQYREKSEQKFRAGFEAMQEVCAQHFPDLDFSIFSLIRREDGAAPMVMIDTPEGDEASVDPSHADEPSLEEGGDAHETGNVQRTPAGAKGVSSEAALSQERIHSGTAALNYLLSVQKPYGDRTGLGYH